jgi:SPP1 family predicted phage head-tail adaptor
MGIFSFTPLDRTITFQRPIADTSFDGPGSGTWEDVATVRANVKDMTVARAERMAEVVSIASRPATVLIRYRDGITADMRILYGDRVMQIVAPPAELGRREALQIMTQDYSSSGNAA